MTSENFLHYLKNPAHLYEITYQELKSLVMQYPYCHNLRYLLVTKSKIDNHRDYKLDLQLASTYSIDRTVLHNQVIHNRYHQTSTDGTLIVNEDYLELTELSKLETKVEKESVISLTEENEPIDLSADQNLLNVQTNNFSKTVTPSKTEKPNLIDEILAEDELESEMASDNAAPLEEEVAEVANIINYEDLINNDIELEEVEDYQEDAFDDDLSPEYNSDSELDVLLSDEDEEEDNFDDLLDDDEASHHQSDPEIELSKQQAHIPESPKAFLLPEEAEEAEDYEFEEEEVAAESTEEIHTVKHNYEETDDKELFEAEDKDIDEPEIKLKEYKQNHPDSYRDDIKTLTENEGLQPAPKQSFSSWLKKFQPVSKSINYDKDMEGKPDLVEKTAPVAKKKKKKYKTHKIAKKSVIENEDIASETLAHLLASQGYYDKAIKMYERLSMMHPEKNEAYAATIVRLMDMKE